MDQSKEDETSIYGNEETYHSSPERDGPVSDFEIRGMVLSYTQHIMATGLGQIMEPDDVIKLARQLYNFVNGLEVLETPKANSSNVSKFPFI